MKLALSFTSLLLVLIGTLALARDGAVSDVKEFEGTWLPVSAEMAGEPWPDELLKKMKLVLKGENYTVDIDGQIDEGTWKIDPDKSPKSMDIKGTKGPNEGKTYLAIFELKDDTLRVCYDLSGKERPSEFKTKAETQLFLATYKRAKP